ncbi:histidine triad nucleotide-binding protein [Nocardioides speluncae]|uniref:histidine triad nucleotide-binding protein n=1 Tax=Nocardioides speluncae TaxID=2670337 RepID=UPI000D687F42|nr:histidine triad nucleotide-binding protein [Nocardioides speluncae]
MSAPEPSADCLFCKIVAGEIPAEIVHATETVVAFRDVNPQAPTHVLIVPRSHYANAAEVAHWEPTTMSELVGAAAAVADKEAFGDSYRLVFNTGPGAGQTVFHAHLHLLGGRPLTWPPG